MSVVSLIFRIQVHKMEADATWLLSGTFIVTCVRLRTRDQFILFCYSQKLISSSTIEAEIGLMCACMPFFPTIVNNTPALKSLAHSVQSLGSTLRSSRHSSDTDARRSYQKQVSRDNSVEDGLELNGNATPTEPVLPESPKKTPRTEMGAFGEAERPKAAWTTL